MHAMQTHSISIASVLSIVNLPDLQENFCEVMLHFIVMNGWLSNRLLS